jgi:hypothetical protein
VVCKCQNEQANEWLKEQHHLLLPVPHFLVTFTLPQELRAIARSHQKTIYNLLFRASAQALQQLAQDPRFVGGRLGMVGVLHTWTRQLVITPTFIRLGTAFTRSREDRFSNLDQSSPESTSLHNSEGVLTFSTGAFAPGVTVDKATYRM